MSPSRPKRLRIVLGKDRLISLDEPARTYVWDCSQGDADSALSAAFGRLLEECGAKSVDVLLSSGIVDSVVMPGLEHWLSDADLAALGRSRLSAFYGTDQSQREVLVVREGYGMPCLAFSVFRSIIAAIRAETEARGVGVASIRPLAALAIAARSAAGSSQSSALWIEEVDAMWIALRGEGRWLSARNLPTSTLKHASRADLLQRECLAAGLVGIDRIDYASVGCPLITGWGGTATDITGQFIAADRKRLRTAIEFGKKPPPRLGWGLLLIALGLAVATAYAWMVEQTAYGLATDALAQRHQSEILISYSRRTSEDGFEANYARAMAAYRFQTAPWPELFLALNECGGEAIGLTQFNADALENTLLFEGEAKRFEDLQEFADALGNRPRLANVRITSLVPGSENAAGRIKFAVAAGWSSGVSVEGASKP